MDRSCITIHSRLFSRMPQTENKPKKRTPAPKETHPPPPACSRQTSCGSPDPTSRTSERSKTTKPLLLRGVVIEVVSGDSDDERPPRLAAHSPTPPKSSTGGSISPTPVPSLSGTGDHIFHIPCRRPTTRDTPVDTPTTHPVPTTFDQHLHLLRFRHPERTCSRFVHCPTDGNVGDGDGWYYVTVGRTVGVFNTW